LTLFFFRRSGIFGFSVGINAGTEVDGFEVHSSVRDLGRARGDDATYDLSGHRSSASKVRDIQASQPELCAER
jgi:hypothetical protein